MVAEESTKKFHGLLSAAPHNVWRSTCKQYTRARWKPLPDRHSIPFHPTMSLTYRPYMYASFSVLALSLTGIYWMLYTCTSYSPTVLWSFTERTTTAIICKLKDKPLSIRVRSWITLYKGLLWTQTVCWWLNRGNTWHLTICSLHVNRLVCCTVNEVQNGIIRC